jgi:peptidyl-prolyl cis-trans isomerase B (cyclophilin B)
LEDNLASKKKQQNLFSSTNHKLAEYEAKQKVHAQLTERRKNDNRVALIAGVAALVVAFAAQFGYSALHPAPAPSATAAATTPASAAPTPAQTNGPLVPKASLAENRVWNGTMQVNNATLGVKLYGDKAPQATANFIALSKKGFYNNVPCHRLTTSGIYVLQCGDPTGTGTGGPGYSFGPIENAPAPAKGGIATYTKGMLAMANSGGAYTNGSQFFIVYADSPLMPNYTVFGEISSGLNALDPIIKAGVSGGGSDGKPAVATKLGAIKLN